MRGHGLDHRAQEVVGLHLGDRYALEVVVGRGVEAGVDAAGCRGDGACVLLDRRPVEDVEARDVCRAAVGPDALGHLLKGSLGAAGEVHVGALAGVGARDRGADRPGCAVNDRRLLV